MRKIRYDIVKWSFEIISRHIALSSIVVHRTTWQRCLISFQRFWCQMVPTSFLYMFKIVLGTRFDLPFITSFDDTIRMAAMSSVAAALSGTILFTAMCLISFFFTFALLLPRHQF